VITGQPTAELPKQTSGFDFLVGDWTIRNRRLRSPLTGSHDWYETPSIAHAATMHNGAISLEEIWFPELGFAGASFRTYEADRNLWTIYWVNSRMGYAEPPVRGRWDSSGELFEAYGEDEHDGIPIQVRFRWHSVTPVSAEWEQAFSRDGGATWETNWYMHWTRDGSAASGPT
jgi:hypothetical protein